MRRALFAGIALCFAGLLEPAHAEAGSFYRVYLNAHRQMLHQQVRMMRHQVPHPFMDRLWGIADNHLLQTGGPFDQLIAGLLANNLPNSSDVNAAGDSSTMQVAQRDAVLDQGLLDADAKVRAMCQKLNIAYVEIPNAAVGTTTTQTTQTTVNGSQVDSSFMAPAPVPDDYTPPTGDPPAK